MSLFFMHAVPRVHAGWLDQRQLCAAPGTATSRTCTQLRAAVAFSPQVNTLSRLNICRADAAVSRHFQTGVSADHSTRPHCVVLAEAAGSIQMVVRGRLLAAAQPWNFKARKDVPKVRSVIWDLNL